MSAKDNAKSWAIPEQIVEDPLSGLTFQFEVAPDGERVLRVYGDVPFGNRQFNFSADGELVGTGTSTRGLCKPSWLTEVDT
jgi:hypothetical protein